jgi:hypothetical protein
MYADGRARTHTHTHVYTHIYTHAHTHTKRQVYDMYLALYMKHWDQPVFKDALASIPQVGGWLGARVCVCV